MNLISRLLFVVCLGLLIANVGCASRKTTKRVNALEAQMGVVTDELIRLDQSVADGRTDAAPIQAYEPSGAGARGSVYRTPSGFELPAVNIQQALKNAGYYNGKLDGKIGSATQDALRSFQRDNGLDADGVCGRQTWNKLKAYLGSAIK